MLLLSKRAARRIRPRGARPPAARPPAGAARRRGRASGIDRFPLRARGRAPARAPRGQGAHAPGPGARIVGRAAGPHLDRRHPGSGDASPRVEPLRRAPRADRRDAARHRHGRRRSSGCRLPLLHVHLDHGARHARVRAKRRPRRRARPAQSARRRDRRGQRGGSDLRLICRALPAGHPSRPDDRRDRALPQRAARYRLPAHRRPDAWVEAPHAVGRHGLPWVPPSPMPTLDTARVYPGGCLIEGTNLSEGRGTTRPFEWIGAPYLDAHRYPRSSASGYPACASGPRASSRRFTSGPAGSATACRST